MLNPEPAACFTETSATFTVTDPPTITDVEPDAVCTSGDTVEVFGTGFVEGMTVTVGGVTATEVVVNDPTYLTATVPSGVPVGPADVVVTTADGCSAEAAAVVDLGDYDVIVVNPDGSVGALPAAVEVTDEPPPTVETVSPASIPASGDQAITVYGAAFRSPSLELDCADPAGGAVVTVSATVTSSTDNTLSAVVPTDLTGTGVCVLRVTNGDGPWVLWSGMSVTNPSQNLFDWRAGTPMTQARRAPAAVAGRATEASRLGIGPRHPSDTP